MKGSCPSDAKNVMENEKIFSPKFNMLLYKRRHPGTERRAGAIVIFHPAVVLSG